MTTTTTTIPTAAEIELQILRELVEDYRTLARCKRDLAIIRAADKYIKDPIEREINNRRMRWAERSLERAQARIDGNGLD